MRTIQKILVYTRPSYERLQLKLVKRLQNDFPGASVQFATFYHRAYETVRNAGYEAVYLPRLLAETRDSEPTGQRMEEMDSVVRTTCGAGINLMLQSERFLPSDQEKADRFCRQHMAVLDRLIPKGTLSINYMFDHFVYWLAGALAEARNGYHFGFVPCGMPPGRVICLRTPWETWRVSVTAEAAADALEAARRSLEIPTEQRIEYMKAQAQPTWMQSWRPRLEDFLGNRRDYIEGSYFATRQTVLDRLCRRILRNRGRQPEPQYDIVNEEQLAAGPQFVYCPLHMEPEATILMYSPWIRDQREAVRIAAQALPAGWRLLVKENPKMAGVRAPAFYQDIRSIPNVVLASPTVPSVPLMKQAQAVIAIAGTACLEAAVLGRAAICFGRPPFRGVLLASDFAGGKFAVGRLTELFLRKNAPVDPEAWRQWVSSTFTARAVPVMTRTERQIDYADANVDAYYRFICAAIAKEEGK